MRRIILGFKIYFSGIKFWLSQKSLLRLSIIPFILDFICLAAGLSFVLMKLPAVISHLVHKPELWYQYIYYYLVYIFTALILFLITLFVVSIVANFIAFPFNDLLSQKTLLLKSALSERERSVGGWLKHTQHNLIAMAKKTLVLLVVACLLIVAALIPGVGIFAAFISLLLMSYELCDYSFDHFQLTFAQRWQLVRQHFFELIGFSLALGLTSSIPVLNILILPGGVVAAALLVAEIRGRGIFERSHT
jgi:CysZ protein